MTFVAVERAAAAVGCLHFRRRRHRPIAVRAPCIAFLIHGLRSPLGLADGVMQPTNTIKISYFRSNLTRIEHTRKSLPTATVSGYQLT